MKSTSVVWVCAGFASVYGRHLARSVLEHVTIELHGSARQRGFGRARETANAECKGVVKAMTDSGSLYARGEMILAAGDGRRRAG